MSDKTQKLKEILNLLSDSLTKSDFTSAFSAILKQLLELEKNLIAKIDSKTSSELEKLNQLKKEFEKIITEAKNESDSTFAGFKRKTEERLQSVLSKAEDKIAEVDEKLASVRSGIDGKDADEEVIVGKVLKKIPSPEIDADKILDKITGLITIDDIQNLKKELEELRKIRATGGGFSFGGLVNTTRYADLSSQCNGSNKIFTVPRHRKIVLLTGTDFPIVYRPTTDFITANLILTLTSEVSAPSLGATLIFQYVK